MERRKFIKNSTLATATLAISQIPRFGWAFHPGDTFVSNRPLLKDRKFVSEAVERKIIEAKKKD